MEGININERFVITEQTTPEEIANALMGKNANIPDMVRAIRIYGKMKVMQTKQQAIEIVKDIDPGAATPIICNEIAHIII